MTRALRLTVAQTHAVAGDLAGNSAKVLAAHHRAQRDQADLAVTGELALTGYPIDDLAGSPDFLDATQDALDALAAKADGPPLLVGTLMRVSDLDQAARRLVTTSGLDASERSIVNALVLIDNHTITTACIKSLLPTYGVFDDSRWIAPARSASAPVTINGVNVGLAICEDIWTRDIVDQLADAGAHIVISANASPYSEGKQHARRRLIDMHQANHPGIAFAYVNLTGGQDEVVYDGASHVRSSTGETLMRLPAFTETTATVDIPLSSAHERERTALAPAIAATLTDTEATYQALTVGLRDYLEGTKSAGVIIGLSGGLDSALAATLAVDAIGAEKVLGVAMPGPYSSSGSLRDARALADNLGIEMVTLAIDDGYRSELDAIGALIADTSGEAVAKENIQARLRALHLMTLANATNRITLNTGNKSEASVGYFTLGGDSSGGFAVLKDVYKTRAYELARWRNHDSTRTGKTPPIPDATLTKPPSAELADNQKDTDSLPDYPVLDAILSMHLEQRMRASQIAQNIHAEHGVTDAAALVERVVAMVTRSEHKRRQVAPGIKITDRAYGRDRRMPVINGYTPSATSP